MAGGNTSEPGSRSGGRRWGHAQDEQRIDPYKRPQKLAEPTACPQCGAVYHQGCWQWSRQPPEAAETLCQACLRSNDHYPAGVVTLSGEMAAQLKTELLNLARHQEQAEKAEHPMNRIIEVIEAPGEIVINTADIHLPRRIGEAIHRAHHGKLDMQFDENAYFVRVTWRPGK